MIIGKLKDLALYVGVHPKFGMVCDYLLNTDLLAAPAGKVHLDGDDVFVNILDFGGKAEADCRMETHETYIDIQVPVNCDEMMGWKAAADLCEPIVPYSAEEDIAFFGDKATNLLNVLAGEFIIFFSQDGHQPGIAGGKKYRKIIVKIRA